MSEQKPPEAGWKYRLVVAFVSAVAVAATLVLLPLILALGGGAGEALSGYKLVFSAYGAAIVAAFGVAGFLLSGERTAKLFSFLWGTHPVWSRMGSWFDERPTLTIFLMLVFLLLATWLLLRVA
jgi:uncharacterized membrane protein YdfJ with MMPL/SSD domain